MFIDYKDIESKIERDFVYTFYGCQNLHNEIISSFLDWTQNKDIPSEYYGRAKVNSITRLEELPLKKETGEKGRLSLDWIEKTTLTDPCVLTLIYDAKNKDQTLSWSEFENNMSTDIYKIRQTDISNYCTIQIFIYSPDKDFLIDNVIDKDKPFSLKKQIDTKIYHFTDSSYFRVNSKKFQYFYWNKGVSFYKQLKKDLKIKKTNLHIEDFDGLIKVNLKLGILSLIKNKRISFKYIEEALLTLMKLDSKESKEVKEENKIIGTYLLRRLVKFKMNHEYLKQVFNNFINCFSNGNKLCEYYWLATEYEFFGNTIKNLFSSYPTAYFNCNFSSGFPGSYLLKAAYNYNRLLNKLKDFKGSFDKKITVKKSNFMGKQPSFYIYIDPLNPKELPFEEDMYFKYFIDKYNLTQEEIFKKMSLNLNLAQNCYYEALQKVNSDKGEINYCSNLTFNSNLISFIEQNDLPKEKLLGIYRHCLFSKDLEKFPQIKLKFLENFNAIVKDPDTILSNLFQIANFRKLTNTEEETFFHIINNEKIQQKYVLGKFFKTNNVLNYKINIKNNSPHLHDITEYEFIINSNLKDKVKFNKIKFFFSNPERNFSKDYRSSDPDFPMTINHSIFVRESDKNLKLLNITSDLKCCDGSLIILDVILPQDENKQVLNLKLESEKRALKFEFEPKVSGCIQQNIVFSFKTEKINSNIKVDSLNMKFAIKENEVNLKSANEVGYKRKFQTLLGSNLLSSSLLARNISKQKENVKNTTFLKSNSELGINEFNDLNVLKSALNFDEVNEFNRNSMNDGNYSQMNQIVSQFKDVRIEESNLENIKEEEPEADQINNKVKEFNEEEITKNTDSQYDEIQLENINYKDENYKDQNNNIKDHDNIQYGDNQIINQEFKDSAQIESVFESKYELNKDDKQQQIQQDQEISIYQSAILEPTSKEVEISEFNVKELNISDSLLNNQDIFKSTTDQTYSRDRVVSIKDITGGNTPRHKRQDTENKENLIENIDNQQQYTPTKEFKHEDSIDHKEESVFNFYWINEENQFVENENLNYSLKNVDDNNTFNFFIKFTKAGKYKMTVKVQYKLSRTQVDNDYITVVYTDDIEFTITDLFTLRHEIPNQAYISADKKKYYLLEENIKVDLELQNKSCYDIKVYQCLFESQNDQITIKSYIDKIFSLNPIKISSKDELVVPIIVNSKQELEFPGWVKLLWREEKMENYINSNIAILPDLNELYNEVIIPLEKIDFRRLEIKMSIKVGDVKYNEYNEFEVILENKTQQLKRVHFLIDNASTLLIQGSTKKKLVIPPFSTERIQLGVIPLIIGHLKIPVFKIIEYNFIVSSEGRLEESKLSSVYYYPDTIQSIS